MDAERGNSQSILGVLRLDYSRKGVTDTDNTGTFIFVIVEYTETADFIVFYFNLKHFEIV